MTMRKLLLAVLFLSLVPATNAQALVPATGARTDRGILTDHLATVDTSEVWENGSQGHAFVRVGWPAVDYTVHIHWIGILYDDAGDVLINGRDYDIEWENRPLQMQPAVEEFHLRGLQRARFRFVQPDTACMDYFDDCIHTVVLHVRWRGFGPVTTVDQRNPTTGVGLVGYHRAAAVRGELTIDGMRVPGGDLDLGTGDLFRQRYFGP
jgi:hypothetical protein